MPVNTLDLKRRLDVLRAARSSVESAWNDTEKYVFQVDPGNPRSKTEASAGWKQPDVWDHTATDGCQKLAANLHGSITPSGVEWMQFGTLSADGTEYTVNKVLDQIRARVFTSLQESDFDSEMSVAFLELVGRGNGFLVLEPMNETHWEGFDFTAVPARESNFEPDSRGNMKRFFRDLQWTPSQMTDRFRTHTRPLPDHIKKLAENPDQAAAKQGVVFAIFEREEITKKLQLEREMRAERRKAEADGKTVEGEEPTDVPLAPELRPYGYVYFLTETGEQLGDEGGYYEMPVFHAAWEKMAGSQWGRGPGMTVVPTVKYLNTLLEQRALALAKAVNPSSMTTERGLLSDIDHSPGSRVVVRDLEKSLKTFESEARFDVAYQEAAELRAMIRSYFFVDELQLKESPAMTATEARIRYELMNRLFGPTLGRIQSTLLSPMLKVAINHLTRAGQMPELPAELVDADVEIKYLGPIASARNSDKVAAIERVAAMAAGLIKMGFEEEPRDTFDPEKALRKAAELQGCPTDILRDPADVKKRREARAALQKRMAAAEATRAEGEAVQQAATAASAVGEVTSVPASPTPIIAPAMGAA